MEIPVLPARDEDGFLQEPGAWSEEIVRLLAQDEGLEELEEAHWRVIRYVRDFWFWFGRAPSLMDICQGLGLTVRTFFRLFPYHPLRTACRLAGLPRQKGLGYYGCGCDL